MQLPYNKPDKTQIPGNPHLKSSHASLPTNACKSYCEESKSLKEKLSRQSITVKNNKSSLQDQKNFCSGIPSEFPQHN